MKVRITFDFDDAARSALSARYGRRRPATRADIRSFIEGIVAETMADVTEEWVQQGEEAYEAAMVERYQAEHKGRLGRPKKERET